MKCLTCDSTDVIYSGVDAFMLDVIDLVEKICYTCANEKKGN